MKKGRQMGPSPINRPIAPLGSPILSWIAKILFRVKQNFCTRKFAGRCGAAKARPDDLAWHRRTPPELSHNSRIPMFRWLFRTLFLLALVLVGLGLVRNWIGARLLRSELERVTGLPCAVGSVDLHLSSPLAEACAVSVNNSPYSCRTPMALGIRSISARYDPWALLRGRLHL